MIENIELLAVLLNICSDVGISKPTLQKNAYNWLICYDSSLTLLIQE
jgi:hypothetical protein